MGSTWSAGGRKQAPAEPGSRFHGNGGGSQLIRGRSSQQGLPRPENWGSPPFVRSWGPEFRVGQEGVNGSPPSNFTCAPKSLVPQCYPPPAPLHPSSGCSRTLTATPPPACTRMHDRVGLHARSEFLPSIVFLILVFLAFPFHFSLHFYSLLHLALSPL